MFVALERFLFGPPAPLYRCQLKTCKQARKSEETVSKLVEQRKKEGCSGYSAGAWEYMMWERVGGLNI